MPTQAELEAENTALRAQVRALREALSTASGPVVDYGVALVTESYQGATITQHHSLEQGNNAVLREGGVVTRVIKLRSPDDAPTAMTTLRNQIRQENQNGFPIQRRPVGADIHRHRH